MIPHNTVPRQRARATPPPWPARLSTHRQTLGCGAAAPVRRCACDFLIHWAGLNGGLCPRKRIVAVVVVVVAVAVVELLLLLLVLVVVVVWCGVVWCGGGGQKSENEVNKI
jgi:hypothetical protein